MILHGGHDGRALFTYSLLSFLLEMHWCGVVWCGVMSCHLMSCHVMSCHVMSCNML